MKKFLALLMVLVMCISLSACGNMSWGLGNFTFNHIHFTDHQNSFCAEIEKWYDNSNGIEVKTKEYGSMYLSEGTYMLYGDNDDCPYCNEE